MRKKASYQGETRRSRRALKRYGDSLYHAQVRAHIARLWRQGASAKQIAQALKIPRRDVEEYMDRALERLRDPDEYWRGDPRNPSDVGPQQYRGRRAGQPPPADPPVEDGEILPPPEEIIFRQQAYELRKRAIPFDEIAQALGRTADECRQAVRTKLRELEADELQDTALAKRMMLEQIDSMIAAITVPATGRDINGQPAKVVLEAIDRMVKLLDQKAKLLGLNSPQKVDITHRLEIMAEETGYDIEELRTIAADVLHKYTAGKQLK